MDRARVRFRDGFAAASGVTVGGGAVLAGGGAVLAGGGAVLAGGGGAVGAGICGAVRTRVRPRVTVNM